MARQGLALAGGVIGAIVGGPVGAQIGFAIGAGLGSYIDPEKIQGPRLGEIPMQTGRDGVPIPVGWGVCHSAGNIIIKNEIQTVEKEEGGGNKGGGPTVVNTYYYRTFGIRLMRSIEGPIASVLRIWENEKLVYDKRDTPAIPTAETDAYAAGIRIYLGTESQTPDPDLEAEWGVGTTPYFRGLPYIVWVDKDLGPTAQIPQFRFEITTHDDLTITSRPYSLQEIEALDTTLGTWRVRPYDATIEAIDATFAITDIGIGAVREEYTMDAEALDATVAITDITLDPILVEYTMDSEGFDATFAITDITLDPRRVAYVMDPEAVDATFAITSITLTPV